MQWRWSLPTWYKWKAIEISDRRNKYFFQSNGYWACGIYTAGQVWLRWASDQPLDSPHSASQSLMNQTSQDENYNNNQQEDIVLMFQQILRTLQMWGEMKDSEGELKVVEIWSLFKYKYMSSFTRLKKLKFKLASQTKSSQILLALGKSWFTYFEFLISWRMTSLVLCPFGKWEWIYLSWTTGQNIFLSPGL